MKQLIFGGKIVTMNDNNDIVEAVFIEDDKILAVGSVEELSKMCDEETEEVNLQGSTMFPGFIDPHSHYGQQSILSKFKCIAAPPVADVTSIETMIKELKEAIVGWNPEKVYLAYGYDHEELDEKRHPLKDDLDLVSTEVPIIAIHASTHVGTFNTAALKFFDIKENQEDPAGGTFGRYEGTDLINGYAEESAIQLYAMKCLAPEPEEVLEVLAKGQQLYAQAGITTAQDGFSGNVEYNLFKLGSENGVIDLDIHCLPPCHKSFRGENKWMNGDFGVKVGDSFGNEYNNIKFWGYKLVLDGSPQARTAWMTKPYVAVSEDDDPEYCGYPFYEDDNEVIEAIKHAIDNDAPFLVHCNGDAAGDQLIRCYRKALELSDNKEYSKQGGMNHCQTAREDQFDELAKLNMFASVFPIHTLFWGDTHLKNFGEERANKISNLKYAYQVGLKPTIHEDSPVLPPNPILSMWAACNRKTRSGHVLGKHLRLTREEALRGITINGAYQYNEEAIKGSIEPGKISDFTIVNTDLLTCSDDELFNASVLKTIKRGKVIFQR